MSRGCLAGRPYSQDTHETQLSPSILTLRVLVMCKAHASLRRMLSRELPARTLLTSIVWVFTHSLSNTQPLQSNPTINTRYKMLGHMCFSCYRTYAMILCNSFILWQNTLYLYLGRLRMCLTTSRNHVSRSSVEAFKFVQKIKQECKFIKARQLVDSFSTPPIYRGLRISNFNSDFLGIRESVYGPSFLLTLDI